jgi:hypothetical protein
MTLPLCLASFATSNSLNHHLPLFRDMVSISLTDILPFILIHLTWLSSTPSTHSSHLIRHLTSAGFTLLCHVGSWTFNWPPSLPRYPFNLALTFHRYSALLSRSPASGSPPLPPSSPHSHFSCSLSTGFLPLLFPRQPVSVKQNMIFFPFPPSLSSLVLHLLLQLLPTRPCSFLLHYHLTTYLSYVM